MLGLQRAFDTHSRDIDKIIDYIESHVLSLLRFSGVFSDPGGHKAFLILLSVGYFCY